MKNGEIRFKRKNNISCIGVPFRTLVWNYICWFLAGRPNGWKIRYGKNNKFKNR
jgi:hypothetical protein